MRHRALSLKMETDKASDPRVGQPYEEETNGKWSHAVTTVGFKKLQVRDFTGAPSYPVEVM